MDRYNLRGGAEVEQFRSDKRELHLATRRKHRLIVQKALVLLTDLIHNLLADFRYRGWPSPLCGLGSQTNCP